MAKLRGQAGGAAFLARNLVRTRALQPMPTLVLPPVALCGLSRDLMPSFCRVHEDLRVGRRVGNWRSLLYSLMGRRLVVVAVNENRAVVGLDMYYFEAGIDARRHVHEAYIGVLPDYRALGIASAMRRQALTAFAAGGVHAVTTDIAPDNAASLASAERLGFVVQGSTTESLRMIRRLHL